MSEQLFINQYNQLPDALKKEMLEFLDFLLFKHQLQGNLKGNGEKKTQPNKSPKAGFLKGTFVMSPDFDEPLDDFKEYMA